MRLVSSASLNPFITSSSRPSDSSRIELFIGVFLTASGKLLFVSLG